MAGPAIIASLLLILGAPYGVERLPWSETESMVFVADFDGDGYLD